MILVDYSSIIHRMIFAAAPKESTKAKDLDTLLSNVSSLFDEEKEVNTIVNEDGSEQFITSTFAPLVKYRIISEIIKVKQTYGKEYGEVVICVDNAKNGYWRTDFYPEYKANRKKVRSESKINYKELFAEIAPLEDFFNDVLSVKLVSIDKCEADDIMLVLARQCANTGEKVMIYSPDKDMIQCQIDNENVTQYSALTKKYITKEGDIHDWLTEHICLGDVSDNVPKITDDTQFTEEFREYLDSIGLSTIDELQFQKLGLKNKVQNFTGPLFKSPRIGKATLFKKIREMGGLDNFLDSNPCYRPNYERNKVLVLEEGVPENYVQEIIQSYKNAPNTSNIEEISKFLNEHNLQNLMTTILDEFCKTEIRAINEDFFSNSANMRYF